MYEARDKAFKDWFQEWLNTPLEKAPYAEGENELVQKAFNAGWDARKCKDYGDSLYAKGVIEAFIPKDGNEYKEHYVVKYD